jgi:glycosyltransferase involved in cell wall biosynthesis
LLKSLVQKYQLENKIFIHGNAPDYFKALNDSHIVLQITHLDAMPITVLEAMACGRPVIVSKVGDMPKWVQHDQNGWVCEKVREEDIAEVLEKAWENRGSWESLGKKAFEIFSANYPADPIAYFLKQAGIKDCY